MGIGLKKYFPNADPLAMDLLEQMLHYNPDRRITAENIVRHPYLNPDHFEVDLRNSHYKVPSSQMTAHDHSKHYQVKESLYLSNGTYLRPKPWEEQNMKGSISMRRPEIYSTNYQKERGQRGSLYFPDANLPEKFEISPMGKIVQSKKFHQSLYDPQESIYQSGYRRHDQRKFFNLHDQIQKPINKRKMLRYSEYEREELVTPKASTRRTIDLDSEFEDFQMKHLSYSHGGKELRNIHAEDLWLRQNKYNQRLQYGMEPGTNQVEGGLKMKKRQYEQERTRQRKRHFGDRRNFDTNNTYVTGKDIDLYSKDFSPSKQYKKVMSQGRYKKKGSRGNDLTNKIISAYEDEFNFEIQSESANQNSEKNIEWSRQNSIKQMLMSKKRKKESPRRRRNHTSNIQMAFHAETGGSDQMLKQNPRSRKMYHKRKNPVSIDKKDELNQRHERKMKMKNFIKNKNLRPTLKELKQKYTDNEMGDYSMNVATGVKQSRYKCNGRSHKKGQMHQRINSISNLKNSIKMKGSLSPIQKIVAMNTLDLHKERQSYFLRDYNPRDSSPKRSPPNVKLSKQFFKMKNVSGFERNGELINREIMTYSKKG